MRTVCPGLCVLRFKYLATPTRRTTVTTVGTGLSNHCLHQAYRFYFLNPSISSLLCCVLDRYCLKILTEDFLNFLSSILITHKYRGSQQFSRVEYSTQIYCFDTRGAKEYSQVLAVELSIQPHLDNLVSAAKYLVSK